MAGAADAGAKVVGFRDLIVDENAPMSLMYRLCCNPELREQTQDIEVALLVRRKRSLGRTLELYLAQPL